MKIKVLLTQNLQCLAWPSLYQQTLCYDFQPSLLGVQKLFLMSCTNASVCQVVHTCTLPPARPVKFNVVVRSHSTTKQSKIYCE